jgi:hypothetical protein
MLEATDRTLLFPRPIASVPAVGFSGTVHVCMSCGLPQRVWQCGAYRVNQWYPEVQHLWGALTHLDFYFLLVIPARPHIRMYPAEYSSNAGELCKGELLHLMRENNNRMMRSENTEADIARNILMGHRWNGQLIKMLLQVHILNYWYFCRCSLRTRIFTWSRNVVCFSLVSASIHSCVAAVLLNVQVLCALRTHQIM